MISQAYVKIILTLELLRLVMMGGMLIEAVLRMVGVRGFVDGWQYSVYSYTWFYVINGLAYYLFCLKA